MLMNTPGKPPRLETQHSLMGTPMINLNNRGLGVPATPSAFLLAQQKSEYNGDMTTMTRKNTITGGPIKKNNDIRQLARPGQIRLVNLDLDSPRMQQAMQKLGYEKEDLDTYKRKEHFIEMPDVIPSPKGKNPDATSKKLNYMELNASRL